MTTFGNIADIERQLRGPATSFRELISAGSPFVRVANIIDDLPPLRRVTDNVPLIEAMPYDCPTVGDLRKLRDALVAAGWKPDEAF